MLFQGKYRVESTRLPNHNDAANGWYFITICTCDRQHFFGNIVSDRPFNNYPANECPANDVETLQCNVSMPTGQMQLSPIGKIAQQYWADIPNHFAHTYIDAYVVMPNHIHGIIVISPVQRISHQRCRDVAV